MVAIAVEQLPSYYESVQQYTPPPIYTRGSYKGASSWSRGEYYRSDVADLKFEDVHSADDAVDLERIMSNMVRYKVQTAQELKDFEESVRMIVKEKLIQVERNNDFINKRIRTVRNNCYYIDYLRVTTVDDFNRIACKIQNDYAAISKLFHHYSLFNTMYGSILSKLSVPVACPRGLNQTQLDELSMNITILAHICNNIEMLDRAISKMTSTEEVSYVLKERARIYNDARDFVLRS